MHTHIDGMYLGACVQEREFDGTGVDSVTKPRTHVRSKNGNVKRNLS